MNNACSGMFYWLWISVAILLLDQLVKHYIMNSFYLYEQVSVIPSFFSLTLTRNTGAAFNLLSEESGWQRWFFVTIASMVSIILVYWIMHIKKNWQVCSITMILGGTLSNLYDRIMHGYVVDFLLVYYDGRYFPAFNLADVTITIGAVILILVILHHQPLNHKKFV